MTATSEKVLQQLQLDRLLDDTGFHYDLRQGVLYNPANTRYCLLSTDLLKGVYKALVDEAGSAWTIILKRCGQIWGERLARRLDRELQSVLGVPLGEIPVSQFLDCMHQYFAFHGWGDLRIGIDHAMARGVVEATLRDSIFAEVIEDSEEMVDWLMTGILASLFAYLSGQELDAMQTACATRGASQSSFLISSEERIRVGQERLAEGLDHTRLVESL